MVNINFEVFEWLRKKSPVISFKDFSFQYRAQKTYIDWNQSDIYPGEKC